MFKKLFSAIFGDGKDVIPDNHETESQSESPHMFQSIIDATSSNVYFHIIAVDAGSVQLSFAFDENNKTETKKCMKEMRIAKKMLSLEKKEIKEHMQNIRMEHRQKVANYSPSMRGGGKFGQIVRAATAYNRANARANNSNVLRPFEDYIQYIDKLQIAIDRAILKCEIIADEDEV